MPQGSLAAKAEINLQNLSSIFAQSQIIAPSEKIPRTRCMTNIAVVAGFHMKIQGRFVIWITNPSIPARR